MSQQIGAVSLFTGGAEPTPRIEVVRHYDRGSLHHKEPTFRITQVPDHGVSQEVFLSPATMREILTWYERGK